MTKTAMRCLPRLARLIAAGAAVALPSLAHAAASSSIGLGDPEAYALLAAGLGMVAFMAGRRGNLAERRHAERGPARTHFDAGWM